MNGAENISIVEVWHYRVAWKTARVMLKEGNAFTLNNNNHWSKVR